MTDAPSLRFTATDLVEQQLPRPVVGSVSVMLLLSIVAASAVMVVWQTISPIPYRGVLITIDRLSAVLTLLVGGIGYVTYRFSVRYLAGDPDRGRFLGWLLFTIVAAWVLMLSTHLLLLLIVWALTGVGLDRLLRHYPDRIEAVRAARKQFLISRLGDTALVVAIVICWTQWRTLDLHDLTAAIVAAPGGAWATSVTLLVVLAALTKSAQFPFHSWLPETMESPTPVSALMHAGIINAGGALLLRFAPVLIHSPSALLILVIIGTITASLGMVAMWAQVKVKRTLAWSTVSQMGFMMIQFGLGAFSVALLHLVAHGFYKAWSFLRSSEVSTLLPRPALSVRRHMFLVACGTATAAPAIAIGALITGFSPLHSPGEMALVMIVALSLGQLWPIAFSDHGRKANVGIRLLLFIAVTAGGGLLACGLYRGVQVYFEPVLQVSSTHARHWTAWVAAGMPVTAFLLLTLLHALLPTRGQRSSWQSMRVHAMHGFYFGVMADRLVASIWNKFFPKGRAHE